MRIQAAFVVACVSATTLDIIEGENFSQTLDYSVSGDDLVFEVTMTKSDGSDIGPLQMFSTIASSATISKEG